MRFFNISRMLFLSHFAAVLLVSGSVGTYFYHSASQSLLSGLQERLKNSASLVSVMLDVDELTAIRTEEDMRSAAYENILTLLRNFRKTNPDIAYLYIMRKQGDRVEFVVDTDYTEDQAVPGQIYEWTIPTLLRGFHQPSADDKIHEDEWGVFLSGYAPVEGGRGEYLVGIDMRADEVAAKFRQLRLSGGISLAVSIFLALFFSRFLAGRFTVPITMLISQCRAIAQGRLDSHVEHNARDELDDLIMAFNAMSDKLAESRMHQLQAEENLRKAMDDLEVKVTERTSELKNVNDRLMQEVAEHAKAREALAEAARTDPLTRLLNRRAMAEQMQYQAARVARHKTPFCLLLGDIDFFKEINDRFGHATGDTVLQEVTGLFTSVVRREDLICRWGGEEFLFLLPDTDLEGGRILAEKIRTFLTGKVFAPEKISVTISMGISVFHPGQDLDACIRMADDAMYRAKKAGRNRIEIVDPTTGGGQ